MKTTFLDWKGGDYVPAFSCTLNDDHLWRPSVIKRSNSRWFFLGLFFFGPHTFFFDLPHTIHVCFAASLLIWRENVSQVGEEAFRRCVFEYMSQSIFFGPHTDSCLFWPTNFFFACVCVTGSGTGVQAMPIWIHV